MEPCQYALLREHQRTVETVEGSGLQCELDAWHKLKNTIRQESLMLVLGRKQEKNAAGASRVFDNILGRRLQVFDLLPM